MYGTPNSDTTGGSCVSNTKTPRTVFGAESSGGYRSSAVAPGSGATTTSAYGSACLEFSAFLLCVLAFNSEQACPVSALSLSSPRGSGTERLLARRPAQKTQFLEEAATSIRIIWKVLPDLSKAPEVPSFLQPA